MDVCFMCGVATPQVSNKSMQGKCGGRNPAQACIFFGVFVAISFGCLDSLFRGVPKAFLWYSLTEIEPGYEWQVLSTAPPPQKKSLKIS